MQNIVIATQGLLHFLKNANIPVYSGNKQLNLMDLFPMLKRGLVRRNTLIEFTIIYVHFNGLLLNEDRDDTEVKVIFDNLMKDSFAGNIPVLFHVTNPIGNVSIELEEAIKQGIINSPYNTIESIRSRFGGTLPSIRDMITQSHLIVPNIAHSDYIIGNLKEEDLNKINVEHNVIAAIFNTIVEQKRSQDNSIIWTKVNIYDLMKKFTIIYKDSNALGAWSVFDYIGYNLPGIDLLCVAVVANNSDLIIELLSNHDPRDNDYQAYRLAQKYSYLEIAELLKRNIVERDFYGKEVFRTVIESNVGQTDLPESLYNYTRQL